jgi:hypothetical protein
LEKFTIPPVLALIVVPLSQISPRASLEGKLTAVSRYTNISYSINVLFKE